MSSELCNILFQPIKRAQCATFPTHTKKFMLIETAVTGLATEEHMDGIGDKGFELLSIIQISLKSNFIY